MIKPYLQRIRPYPLCKPTLTYSKEVITFKVTATSDVLMDAILWSVNSTDTDFRNEWEGNSNGGEYSMYESDNDEMFVK